MATLALVSIVLSTSCSALGQQSPSQGGMGGARQRPAVVVSVVPVKEGQISAVLTYSGSIQPKAQVNLVPKASGRIEKILVEVSSVVRAGDAVA